MAGSSWRALDLRSLVVSRSKAKPDRQTASQSRAAMPNQLRSKEQTTILENVLHLSRSELACHTGVKRVAVSEPSSCRVLKRHALNRNIARVDDLQSDRLPLVSSELQSSLHCSTW
jgi:hypothetical protein